MNKKLYRVVGVMSGTSMDGLDLAHCTFREENGEWSFEIGSTATLAYDEQWTEQLTNAGKLSGLGLVALDKAFGLHIGRCVKAFIDEFGLQVDLIASHGHTVFHQPEAHITCQIGDGRMIFARNRLPVAYDFRSLDVALGGQGAPLVPVGDRLLFSAYAQCLNLGGIANISYEQDSHREAFDICPVNMILNELARRQGKPYDEGGNMAAAGKVDMALLDQLNDLDFYRQAPPKSLGREWFEQEFHGYFKKDLPLPDLLRTATEHIAFQLSKVINTGPGGKLLVTGGGAHNHFLISLLKEKITAEVQVPDRKTIEYKEALVFGLLGVLRLRNEINTYASVTGALQDSVGGVLIS